MSLSNTTIILRAAQWALSTCKQYKRVQAHTHTHKSTNILSLNNVTAKPDRNDGHDSDVEVVKATIFILRAVDTSEMEQWLVCPSQVLLHHTQHNGYHVTPTLYQWEGRTVRWATNGRDVCDLAAVYTILVEGQSVTCPLSGLLELSRYEHVTSHVSLTV